MTRLTITVRRQTLEHAIRAMRMQDAPVSTIAAVERFLEADGDVLQVEGAKGSFDSLIADCHRSDMPGIGDLIEEAVLRAWNAEAADAFRARKARESRAACRDWIDQMGDDF